MTFGTIANLARRRKATAGAFGARDRGAHRQLDAPRDRAAARGHGKAPRDHGRSGVAVADETPDRTTRSAVLDVRRAHLDAKRAVAPDVRIELDDDLGGGPTTRAGPQPSREHAHGDRSAECVLRARAGARDRRVVPPLPNGAVRIGAAPAVCANRACPLELSRFNVLSIPPSGASSMSRSLPRRGAHTGTPRAPAGPRRSSPPSGVVTPRGGPPWATHLPDRHAQDANVGRLRTSGARNSKRPESGRAEQQPMRLWSRCESRKERSRRHPRTSRLGAHLDLERSLDDHGDYLAPSERAVLHEHDTPDRIAW